MNTTLKHVAERLLVGSGVARVTRRRLRHRTLVLAYHNVLPDDQPLSGDMSLHLPRREFGRQLDILAETHEVVPLHDLSASSRLSGRPRAVITIDDAYEGALTCGVDELVARGMPATIFVSPALLGSVTWWDILAEQGGGAVPGDRRREALHALGGQTRTILGAAHVDQRESTTTRLPRIGTESQLLEAAARRGITLGSHSWSHPNLSSLSPSDLELELARPLQWLQSRFRTVVPWLSYPYGLFNDTVQNAAERTGYSGAFRIDGGWVADPAVSRYAIPRLNVPAGVSRDGFRLRLSGL